MEEEIIEPAEIAENMLLQAGFVFSEMMNDNYGIVRTQLKVFSLFAASEHLKKNAYTTIYRLRASANKQNIDFAANVKNTMVGTVKFSLMKTFEGLPKSERDNIIIKWVPSSAEEPRSTHALYYGKTMTLTRAMRLGLGLEYGCQCGFKVMKGSDVINKTIKQFDKKVKK